MSRSLAEYLSQFDFAPVVKPRKDWHVFDFTKGYDPQLIRRHRWGIGRYSEKRPGMYVAPQYQNTRNIHMGIDFWMPPGEPVFAFYDGVVSYYRDNDRLGDYGPTIVTHHKIGDMDLFALYGHLRSDSLQNIAAGQHIQKGEQIACIGGKEENGGWEPHLHFQLSVDDPEEADMPGVVAEKNYHSALEKYPDPRLIVGNIY